MEKLCASVEIRVKMSESEKLTLNAICEGAATKNNANVCKKSGKSLEN